MNIPSPSRHQAITPSDSTTYTRMKAIVCLTAGNLVVHDAAGTSVTYPMTAGQRLEFEASRVMAATTGTYAAHF